MQPTEIRRQRSLKRVVDLVVEDRRARRAIDELDADAAVERQRQVAVEAATFLRGGQRGGVGDGPAVRQPEEVEARDRHARLVGVVVEDLQEQRPHALGSRRRERHPDVPHNAWALEVGEHDSLPRLEAAVRCSLAPAVRAAAGAARTGRVLERRCSRIEAAVDDRGVPDAVDHWRATLTRSTMASCPSFTQGRSAGTSSVTGASWNSFAHARRRRSVELGRAPWMVRGWWKLAPPAASGTGTAVEVSSSSTSSRMWTAGSSPRCRCASTSPRCEPGTNHRHPLSTSASSSGVHAPTAWYDSSTGQ